MAAGAFPSLWTWTPTRTAWTRKAAEAAITARTRAIIPVHLGAQMADMDAIMSLAETYNLVVIEDCAHAARRQWNGQGAGTFGHFGSFSLQSSKTLTTGEGGVLICKRRNPPSARRATSIIDCRNAGEDPERAMEYPRAPTTA